MLPSEKQSLLESLNNGRDALETALAGIDDALASRKPPSRDPSIRPIHPAKPKSPTVPRTAPAPLKRPPWLVHLETTLAWAKLSLLSMGCVPRLSNTSRISPMIRAA
jgi:hypothetical protein